MPTPSILPSDDPVSFPSMPTLHGGDPNALGRIDHYDLLRKLGGGGFGVVYLARDTVSGIEVALKTLHPLLKANAEEMDALREKFVLISRLSHPNIATALVLHRVRDLTIWDETARKEMRLSPGDFVVVMRYAPGVTLFRWQRQFPDGIVPLDLVLEVARQLASALDYAHGERIVHRDIKPGNIMIEMLGDASRSGESPRVRVRILDFGLAAEIHSSMSRISTEEGDTSGTWPYMAPEQWLGKKQDGRTDQYALACVLYELLSGAPPFAGVFETGNPVVMMATVKSETPDEIEDVPEAVNAALLRALAKNPKERFPSCTAFVARCIAYSSPSSQRAGDGERPCGKAHIEFVKSTEPDWKTPSSSLSMRRGIWLGVAALIVTIAGALYWWLPVAKNGGAILPVTVANVSFNLRWCPPGTFKMGFPFLERRFDDSKPSQHRVTLTQGFWMGETEVTQELWQKVMGDNPSHNKRGGLYPVENVSWNDCKAFVDKLNAHPEVRAAKLRFAMPTEAQWEYACRAGRTLPHESKARMESMGWCNRNSGDTTHPVAQKEPNAWGFYDMHGNVREQCADWWDEDYPTIAVTDPTGPASGTCHVERGGSILHGPGGCRSAVRSSGIPEMPDATSKIVGFRLAAIKE